MELAREFQDNQFSPEGDENVYYSYDDEDEEYSDESYEHPLPPTKQAEPEKNKSLKGVPTAKIGVAKQTVQVS